jgi:hypothetical protein
MPAESEKIQSGTCDIITVELTYVILIVEPHLIFLLEFPPNLQEPFAAITRMPVEASGRQVVSLEAHARF